MKLKLNQFLKCNDNYLTVISETVALSQMFVLLIDLFGDAEWC